MLRYQVVIPGTVIRHPVEDYFQAQRMGFINESPKTTLVTKLRIYGKIVFHGVGTAELTFAMFLANRMDRHQPEDLRAQLRNMSQFFSNTIKITKGIVSAKRGMGDDSGQFQIDAAVQHGSSGGPIYDENGNIIGVVVSQLNKLKVAKAIGSLPELVNFGIKASTVKQFLNSSGLPSSWSRRSKRMSTKEIAKIAENQTVMVVCHR